MAAIAPNAPAGFDPNNAQNLQEIERQFAVKAVLHAQTYWNLLESRKGSELTLTKFDDEIHEHFKKEFPDYDVAANVDEDHMKSKEGKEKWRKFMQAYEKRIADYNFGTLLRNNPKHEYEEKTTIFVQRMQFYALEIARNKAGLNDWIKETVDKENEKKKAEEEAKAAAEKKPEEEKKEEEEEKKEEEKKEEETKE